jgi:FixJ family two-component response regulator
MRGVRTAKGTLLIKPLESKDAGIVLVIEDDDSVRTAIQRLLNASGVSTATYASAEALLAVGLSGGDSCLISDLKLPGLSGFELLFELRKRAYTQPMILITAHDSRSVREQAERCGVAAVFAKPFHGVELLAAIEAATAQSD